MALVVRASFVLLVVVAVLATVSCGCGEASSSDRASLPTRNAVDVAIKGCPEPEAVSSDIHPWPKIPDGRLSVDVMPAEIIWCSLVQRSDPPQLVERRTATAAPELVARLTSTTMSDREFEAACSMAIRPEPVVFVSDGRETYRVALPRHPRCGSVTASARQALDANDSRWAITEVTEL